VLCPRDLHYEKTFSNMQEVQARSGRLIALCTQGDEAVRRILSLDEDAARRPAHGAPSSGELDIMEIPDALPEVIPLLAVVPLQLLAYYIADQKGTDVDQPRNLAKTVTVE
jgi:glucosamine--fructose-6-phosphate aminotransferase (isomerizing)